MNIIQIPTSFDASLPNIIINLKDIYYELTKKSSGMYCKESLTIEGTAHYYYQPNSIENIPMN